MFCSLHIIHTTDKDLFMLQTKKDSNQNNTTSPVSPDNDAEKPSLVKLEIPEPPKPVEKKIISSGERKKHEFMAALDLLSKDALVELQLKRSERKRRSTANPQFSHYHAPNDNQVCHA